MFSSSLDFCPIILVNLMISAVQSTIRRDMSGTSCTLLTPLSMELGCSLVYCPMTWAVALMIFGCSATSRMSAYCFSLDHRTSSLCELIKVTLRKISSVAFFVRPAMFIPDRTTAYPE